MNFQRIQSIDSQPFDLDKFYANYYGMVSTLPSNMIFEYILFYRYLEKFLEEYQIDLIKISPLDIDIADIVLNLAGEDEIVEYWYNFTYENENLLISTATSCGFEILIFPSDATQWEDNITFSGTEANIAYIIEKAQQDMPDWANIAEDCKDVIEYSYSYMEDGNIYIMRQKDFAIFKKICNEHEFLVAQYLDAERKAIEKIISQLNYPLYFYNSHLSGYNECYFYICFDTGCNGYEELNFMALDWNWITSCIVAKLLIDDFKLKLEKIVKGKGEEELR